MEALINMYNTMCGSNLVNMIKAYNNKYILSLLAKTEFTSHLIESPASALVTSSLIWFGVLLAIYEAVFLTGVSLGLWVNPADEVFKEIPVHCAHVYVSINLLKKGDTAPNYMLKYPIVYHFEFSPEEYAHEEYGTDLKFIKNKVHAWFLTSQIFYKNKEDIKSVEVDDLSFYTKNGKKLIGDDEYLCNLNVGTGDTIFCVIRY